jgi:hypothetical protein
MHADLVIIIQEQGGRRSKKHAPAHVYNDAGSLRLVFENIIGPEEKSDARDIRNDAFFLCGEKNRLAEAKPFEQGDNQQRKKYIVVDHGQELEHFDLRSKTNKIRGMNKNQVKGHHHSYKKGVKYDGNDLG